MNCAAIESILADYLDDTLSPETRTAVDTHLAGCASCREFFAEVSAGASLLARAEKIMPPAELITRIAYQAPLGKTRSAFEEQTWLNRFTSRWLTPVLQPRLVMGMAMTVLSFAMLERCTGIQTQHIQAADLNPVRVWGGVEDKTMRVRDRIVKYYENLRIVYEVETRLRDLQEDPAAQPAAPARRPVGGSNNQNKPDRGSNTPAPSGNTK